MPQAHVRETTRWKRFAAGIALTVLLAALYGLFPRALGFVEPTLRDTLLWKMTPHHEASDDITVIEIDDAALENIRQNTHQKWPWSWDIMAGIIDSLTALGARVITLDVIYSERPNPDELRRNGLAEFPNGLPAQVGDKPGFDVVIDPLPIFEEAVRRSERTVLTYSVSTGPRLPDPLYQRVEAALVDRPDATVADVAERLGADPADVRRFFVTARGRALEIVLAARPSPPAPETPDAARLFTELFPALDYVPPGSGAVGSAEQEAFDAALEYSQRVATLKAVTEVDWAGGGPPANLSEVTRVTVPLPRLIDASAALGFATVFPDADGVIRRVPLVADCDGRPLPQLGLQVAMLARGSRHFSVRRAAPDVMEFLADDGVALRVPVGPKGEMIINWAKGPGGARDRFLHLPVRVIYEHSVKMNLLKTYFYAMEFGGELLPADARDELGREIDEIRRTGVVRVSDLQGAVAFELQKLASAAPGATRPAERVRRAAAYTAFLRQALRERDGATEIEWGARRLAELTAQVRDAVAGRVCFVGMTATSAALDLKPTPIHRDYPGVFAHATVTDNLLRGRFVREAGPWTQIAMILFVGLAVTLCAGWLPSLPATVASAAVMAAYDLGLTLPMLVYHGMLLPLAGPWLAGVASLLGVMVYRELTEGRTRRWITGVFKQYTSDKMVDELVANPDFLVLGGQRREMTVYFSDIAGFTSLSEQLDPARLVAFLQTYLEEMTDRLLEEGATLDKYEGDAVLAFFGAPIAQEDHAARCLRATLAHLRALPRLNERLHREDLLPAERDLRIRIGVSSGLMTVGNFGSSRRFDYSVIGDPVNVGARLEGVNRHFGTTALLSGATRGLADGGFLLRRIGWVRVVGRVEPLDVYELLDPELPGAREGLAEYDAALADFEDGWLNEARQKFEAVLKARPGDGPATAYLSRVDALLRDGVTAKPGPWDMTTK